MDGKTVYLVIEEAHQNEVLVGTTALSVFDSEDDALAECERMTYEFNSLRRTLEEGDFLESEWDLHYDVLELPLNPAEEE